MKSSKKIIAIAIGIVGITTVGLTFGKDIRGKFTQLDKPKANIGQTLNKSEGEEKKNADTKQEEEKENKENAVNELIKNKTGNIKVDEKNSGTVATYENLGFYCSCEKADKVTVQYRKESENTWSKAYEPIYSNEDKMYRGSIVGLEENTDYNVLVQLYKNDSETCYNYHTKTWNENVNKFVKVALKDITNGANNIKSLVFKGINNKYNDEENCENDVWIKFEGSNDCNVSENGKKLYTITLKDGVNLGNYISNKEQFLSKSDIDEIFDIQVTDTTEMTNAVFIDTCKAMIFENVKVTGGERTGIRVTNSRNVKVANCDVSNYGRIAKGYKTSEEYEDYKVAVDENGEVINYDSGILLERSQKITVEKNYVHLPRGTANCWDENYSGYSHPYGPNAMLVENCGNDQCNKNKNYFSYGGNNVIRYNDFIGSENHRYNDVIEGWNNPSIYGGVCGDSDIYGNTLAYGNDDGIELDGGASNIRFYDNKITGTLAGISVSPNLAGPSYIFRNEISNLGDETDKTNFNIKTTYGSGSTRYGKTFLFNNTFFSRAAVYAFYSEESRGTDMVSRNNILCTKGYNAIFNGAEVKQMDCQNDMLYSAKNVLFHNETSLYENVSDNPDDLSSILLKNTKEKDEMPSFENAEVEIFRMLRDDGVDGIDKGTILNNFTDGYIGNKPDMGKYEYGIEESYLNRSSGVQANAYKVNLSERSAYDLEIRAKDLKNTQNINILSDFSGNQGWFKVTLDNMQNITKDTVIKCRIELNNNTKYANYRKGVFIVKLDNGDSIPIFVER